jgi:hypothetical protein
MNDAVPGAYRRGLSTPEESPHAMHPTWLVWGYIAAFGLEEGEALRALLAQGPLTPALKNLVTDSKASAGSPRTTSSITLQPMWVP